MRTSSSITQVDGVCGGDPIIRGTRIRVADVVALYQIYGYISEVLKDYPFLREKQVRDALEYYQEHQAEIEGLMAQDEEAEEDDAAEIIL